MREKKIKIRLIILITGHVILACVSQIRITKVNFICKIKILVQKVFSSDNSSDNNQILVLIPRVNT